MLHITRFSSRPATPGSETEYAIHKAAASPFIVRFKWSLLLVKQHTLTPNNAFQPLCISGGAIKRCLKMSQRRSFNYIKYF